MQIKRLPNTEDIQAAVRVNNGYCPCRPIHTPETKCMCKDFLEQEEGICHCGLYVKIKDNN